MENQDRSLETIARKWNNPPKCPAPVFPVLYFECIGAQECRGFIHLTNLIGDVDFAGYPLRARDILIDSLGRVMDCAFDKFLYPNSIIATWSVSEIKQNILPALKYSGNVEFEREILNDENVGNIVAKMALLYSL
jgi:hypothetical protein